MFSVVVLSTLTLAQKYFHLTFNFDYVIWLLLALMIVGNFIFVIVLVYLHFSYHVSEELCQLLGIKRFTITPKPKKT